MTRTTVKRLSVGYLLPRLLILIGLLDGLLRIAAIGWADPSAKKRIPQSEIPGEPFERNVQVHIPKIYGNLADMGNVRDENEIRSVQFSTNPLGFRNTGLSGRVQGILLGDSFAWGGDNDNDTLPAQLGSRLGCHVFNAAGSDIEFRRPSFAYINTVAQRTGMAKGLVIIQELEQRSFERIRTQSRRRARAASWWAPVGDFFRKIYRTSPVKRYAENALRAIYDDKLLPNAYQVNVVRGQLRNGDRMLFLPSDLRPPDKARPFPVEYWQTLRRELQKSERKLLVVIVPNKYTVYQHLVREPRKLPMHGEELVNRVESGLRSLNIPVVNLTRTLKAHAEAGIDRREYVYWRNDTHWNRLGIALAAEEIVRALPELATACK